METERVVILQARVPEALRRGAKISAAARGLTLERWVADACSEMLKRDAHIDRLMRTLGEAVAEEELPHERNDRMRREAVEATEA